MAKVNPLSATVKATVIQSFNGAFTPGQEVNINRVSKGCVMLGVEGQLAFIPFGHVDEESRKQIARLAQEGSA